MGELEQLKKLEDLKNDVFDLTFKLIKEDVLDEQFRQLQKIELPHTPNFVYELVDLYYSESDMNIAEIYNALQAGDLKKVDDQAMKLKGSSVSIGAKQVTNACNAILRSCKEKNLDGCNTAFMKLKGDQDALRSQIAPILSAEQEILKLLENGTAGNNS